jgi:hypothetical protein
MPGASIRIGYPIGDLGERAVCAAPFIHRSGKVDHRAQKRMPEPHSRGEFDEAGRLLGGHGLGTDAEPVDRPAYGYRIAHRLRGGDQQHLTHRVR